MDLKGKVVLVTGASRGIGAAAALAFASEGARIALNCNESEDDAAEIAEEIREMRAEAALVKADVSNEEDVKRMFREVEAQFGGLDILINNAGIDVLGKIEDIEPEDWKQIISINLIGPFLCTKYAVPLLKRSSSPLVLNVSSQLGFKPLSAESAYCCSKAGMTILSEVSHIELEEFGIRVNTIVPPATETDMLNETLSEQEIENLRGAGKLGQPEEVAGLMVQVAKDDSIKGQVVADERVSLE